MLNPVKRRIVYALSCTQPQRLKHDNNDTSIFLIDTLGKLVDHIHHTQNHLIIITWLIQYI